MFTEHQMLVRSMKRNAIEHNYAFKSENEKRQKDETNELKMKIKILKQRNKKITKRLEDCLTDARAKEHLSKKHLEDIKNYFPDLQKQLTNKTHTNSYSEVVKKFALYLYYASTKAYKFVKKTFNLPSISTIRHWLNRTRCDPGFTEECLLQIKAKTAKSNYPIYATLMMDGMAIRKHVAFDGNKITGYSEESNSKSIIKECVVVMAVAINANWKSPIGYFPVSGLRAEKMANIIKEALHHLHNSGLHVISVTGEPCCCIAPYHNSCNIIVLN